MKRILVIALSAACIAAGFVMREKNIGHRMPHADEAEQATTASELIDTGVYKYNPNGPHGPSLYYWAAETLGVQPAGARISDFRKTLTPVAAALLVLLILTGRYLGRTAAWAGAACLAMSAFFQIYSGYFVHEIIFAALIYALALAAWQFACSPNVWLALLAGILLGLSQATKETAVISYVAMAGSFAVCAALEPRIRENLKWIFFSRATPKLLLCAFAGAAAAFVLLYSSFGSNWAGVTDAVKSYCHFFDKAGSEQHASGALFYIKLLFIQKSGGAYFGEIAISALAIFGFLAACLFRKKAPWQCTFAIYAFLNALFAVAALSLITYKTPWLLLSPMVFLCAAAGFGASRIVSQKNVWVSLAAAALLGVLAWRQFALASNASLRFDSDPRNPYIYSHTVRDFGNLISRVNAAAKFSQHENDIPVAFITENSPWPAPFMLRKYRNAGFWSGGEIPENIEVFDVVVCDAPLAAAVGKKLDLQKYETELYGLRKNLLLTAYIKKDIFDKIISEEK